MFQPHRNAELRESVGEVGGSVQRVHVPAELALHPFARALFAVDSVLGEGLAQAVADEFFHRAVGYGHQVHVALVLGLHALSEVLAQTRARLARNLGGLGNVNKIGCDHSLRRAAHSPASFGPGASTVS